VIEGRVDDAIRYGCSTAQAFEVFQITSMHLCTGVDKSLGARVGASKTKHLMAGRK
jgi:hypothetical protein